jgi:hypothetical protein
MAYEINWEQKGMLRRFSGSTSDLEIMQSVSDTSGDPRFETLRYIINDFTACDDVSYTKEGTELISALGVLSELSNPHFKVAIVAAKPATGNLAKSYLSATLSNIPTRMFATLGEAREWLAMSNT